MRSIFQSILILIILTGCAGYKVRSHSNPFARAGIDSIAVPMFINRTSLEKVSANYTREVIETLSGYSNLSIRSGNLKNEDAVLLGIIRPRELSRRGNYVKKSSLMTDEQKESISNRNAFEVPTVGGHNVVVDIIVLKRPTRAEIQLFTSELDISMSEFPQKVFSHSFNINGSYAIENEVGNIDSGAPLRGVQNRGKLRKSIVDSSKTLALEFKEVLSNAF